MQQEVWKDIPNYEGFYQVSNLGNVKSLDRYIVYPDGTKRLFKSKIQKKTINSSGYVYYDLYIKSKRKRFLAHMIVYIAFVSEYDRKLDINHIDCNKTNNNINNLELTTRSENMIHALKNNLLNKTINSATKHYIEINGISYPLKEISKKYNLPYSLVLNRFNKGYSIDEILNIKPRHSRIKYNNGTFVKDETNI